MSIERLYKPASLLGALLILISGNHAQDVTFVKDIAPIIQARCTPCHKPGETAPFSLITYEDVVKRASFIKDVVQK